MELAYISVLGTVAGILFAYLGYKRGQRDELNRQKNEYKKEGAEEGTLRADIEYIKRRSDDMLLEQKETNKNINVLSERLARVEESTKSAHHRIDKFTEDCKDFRSKQGHC